MPNQPTRVIVIGSSFAGLTAALELRKKLDDAVEIAVLDPHARFTFIPSLIWVPFGGRQPEDVMFDLDTVYRRKGIRFINEAAGNIDTEARTVTTMSGVELGYDRLVVATGPRLAFEKVPGLGPEGGFTQSVCNLDHALAARDAWDEFLKNPGPVVVGTAQGGSCFGASYEFALNLRHQIGKAGLEKVAPVTFITAEPFLGHFGLGGVGDSSKRVEKFFDRLGIEGIANNVIKEARDGEIELEGGRVLPAAYSMVVPPFTGVDVVTKTEGLGNAMGFVPVDDEFRHQELEDVYSAGVAIAITPPGKTAVPAGVPKTGQMSDAMAKVVAHNIAADLGVGEHKKLPLTELSAICMLDAGNNGVIFKATNVLGDEADKRSRVTVGPHAHVAKLAFEKFYLGTRRRGINAL
jgi:sulfide:quinone oxidoreductase